MRKFIPQSTEARQPSIALLEGPVAPGDALRARIHFLTAQHQALIGQTQFADAKAAALMTLVGVVALRGPLPIERLGAHPVGVALGLLIATAIIACLWAIMPRYPRRAWMAAAGAKDAYAWTGLASPGWEAERYTAFARDGDFADLIASIAAANVASSKVLAKKFRATRLAAACAIGSVILVVCKMTFDMTLLSLMG